MPAPSSFDCAIIRVVPRVEREEFLNAGVVLYCLSQGFLQARVALDVERLKAFSPSSDPEFLQSHLDSLVQVCEGGKKAGPIGALSQKERWHWVTAPRSTMIQTSPVHTGLCSEPGAALEHLMKKFVLAP